MKNYWILFVLFLGLLSACSSDEGQPIAPEKFGTFGFKFDAQFGNRPLGLGAEYTTPQGEQIRFTRFEYILSNFAFIRADGSEYLVPDSYYFMGIGQANATMRDRIIFANIPEGDYVKIRFSVGVDPEVNTSTDDFERGELTTDVGMSWNWTTGYIFMNWEGEYLNTEAQSNKDFRLHIGTNENYKVMEYDLGETIRVRENRNPSAHFYLRVEKTFEVLNLNELGLNLGGNTFTGVMVNPAAKASQIANTWKEVFYLDHMHD